MEDCYQMKNWKKQYVRHYRMMHQMQQGLKNGAPIISGMIWSSKHKFFKLYMLINWYSFTGPFSNHLCWTQEPKNCTTVLEQGNSLLKHNQHIAQKRVYSVHSTGFFTE